MEDALQRIVNCPDLSQRLQKVGKAPVVFENVDSSARAFVAHLAARQHSGRVWFVCPDVRTQEDFAVELADWMPDARLFPDLEMAAGTTAIPDAETESERLALLQRLARGEENMRLIVTTAQWDQAVVSADLLESQTRKVKKGGRLDPEAFARQLTKGGYERVPQVFTRGQFSIRGGILDVFSWQHELPIRVELFDEDVESIREFDIDTQTTVRRVASCEVVFGDPHANTTPLSGYRSEGDLLIDVGGGFDEAAVQIFPGSPHERPDFSAAFYPTGLSGVGAGDIVLDEARRAQFFRQISDWLSEDWAVVVFCNNEGEMERFREIARENQTDPEALRFQIGHVSRGFLFPAGRVAVLSDAEIFGRAASQRARTAIVRRERARARRQAMDFSEFEEGDLVVHLEHGIGRYLGTKELPLGAGDSSRHVEWDDEAGSDSRHHQTVLDIEYADDARLYVPLDQAWQVSRYVGVGKKSPTLSQMGDGKWAKTRKGAERAVLAYAERLLKIQAERLTENGHAFPADTEWQREFENAFLFKATPDQTRSLADIKTDMQSGRPMDRLLCGDVGFGKTEVAVRAVFKAVMGGKQAAILAPTTVLAQQHYQTFRERMSDYPVTIELLSRYRTPGEQKKTISRLKTGDADIVIGTHRLISADVEFKDLGLVVVDEEQRFGVAHKERLKERFRKIDVLTLSATPIPRTLYMAMVGARDMSVIETPPPSRQPVETVVCAYDERVIRDAIRRELDRGGQVYFLHNRVKTIENVRARIKHLCPNARVDIGHGQMAEGQLEDVMKRFIEGGTDVLVSTTIIESGLDIPNANTILIDRADRFGLADLYQLRGRVGRAGHKAYAYLLLPRDMMAGGDAKKRVSAIRQYSELGAGFKIAMRDLEIRGAGNILGTAQSGHIVAVGFDLYCRMLKNAVGHLSGEARKAPPRATVRLDFVETGEADFLAGDSSAYAPAFLPSSYVPTPRLRIEAYRKIAEVETVAELQTLEREWEDRYGPVPQAASHLLLLCRIQLVAGSKHIGKVESRDERLMLTRRGDFVLMGGRFPRLTASDPTSKFREVLRYVESF